MIQTILRFIFGCFVGYEIAGMIMPDLYPPLRYSPRYWLRRMTYIEGTKHSGLTPV